MYISIDIYLSTLVATFVKRSFASELHVLTFRSSSLDVFDWTPEDYDDICSSTDDVIEVETAGGAANDRRVFIEEYIAEERESYSSADSAAKVCCHSDPSKTLDDVVCNRNSGRSVEHSVVSSQSCCEKVVVNDDVTVKTSRKVQETKISTPNGEQIVNKNNRRQNTNENGPKYNRNNMNNKEQKDQSNKNNHSHSHHHHNHHQHHHHHHGNEHNMRAVFLHILSDLFASMLVIVTATAYILMDKYGQNYGGKDAPWLLYIDPALSIVIVVIIVVPTYKLIREASEILLNNAPHKISPHKFAKELSRHIPEVSSVHDFYLWHLTADIIVATIHVVVRTDKLGFCPDSHSFEQQFMKLSRKVNAFFHDWGVHTTTIQIEFADPTCSPLNECLLSCESEKAVSGVSNYGRNHSNSMRR